MTPLRPKRTRSRILFAATALATALALSACSASGAETTGEGTEGDSLSIAIANDPLSFNPAGGGGGNDTWNINRQIYDSLVYQNPDTGKTDPWLAESFTVNEDATEFTFTLRENVTFSDGSALTAETVKANFDDIKAAGATATSVADLRTYSGTEVVDEHTALIRFDEPNASFLTAATGVALAIVSEKSLALPFEDRYSGEGVSGSGPFTLADYQKDSAVTLAKREGYTWAPEHFENRGDAHVDTVEFKIVPESGNRTGGLSSGQIDVASSLAPHDIATVEASESIVSRANPGTVFGPYYNFDKPVFQDEKVREAIAHAVDATEIRDGALSEHFQVATSPLSASTNDYVDVSEVIAEHDPERAKELLEEAGWIEGADGIREKDGEQLEFRIAYSDVFGPNADTISIFQEQLRAVGIEIIQLNNSSQELLARFSSGDFEIAWRNLSKVDGDVLRGEFGEVGSDINHPIPDEDIQHRLAEQVKIGDPVQRSEALASLQRDIVERDYLIPVHELTTVFGVSTEVSGLSLGADSRLDLLIDVQLND